MPRSTIHGDDSAYSLSSKEIDKLEAELRKEARMLLVLKRAKESKELNSRAKNISRKKSKKAQHH